MYGLKQLGRLWNQNVIAFYKSIGFKQLNKDPNILIWQTRNEISIISVYIDNFLLASNTITTLKALKKLLGKEYEMKDFEEVKTIIRWQITKDLVAYIMKMD